ncbi:glycoside hydrolase family 3 N-terminal domain-containing protein [Pelagicoccus sp. SDUM812003]|uniref:glycoside hydrolase family 3 N-terminal domain-containing protein n=1 Tax=Pelagicoccus sp. SDUM812003 TaxID=3041267 RepID=UPI00280E3B4E|nr:glycoside hydrolase family 3 N-terminal domain-containing protein [Pelagicoccus sp. SDUM812003]MDQ8205016.1 glycoside hydrolase family 3 N-terminal domain-containing protein [Pelagicoccus sp. SDUM812003]
MNRKVRNRLVTRLGRWGTYLSVATAIAASAHGAERSGGGAYIDFNKNGQMEVYEDSSRPEEARIDDLISRMNLREKVAQMTTLYGFSRILKDEVPTEKWMDRMWIDGIGNIDEQINGNEGWTQNLPDPENDLPWSRHAAALREIQRWFIENTRLGIPVDFTNEGIRGVMHSKTTSFPAELGVASTWNTNLVREIGRVTGREAKALGYTNVYSPVLDVSRDPRWGRIIESYGEDPFLVGELGLQQVLGIQEQGVASTLKHFAVYGVPKGGRDGHARTDPHVTWSEVNNIYLAPFKKAIVQGGAIGVMSSYNDYDGVPVQASKLFLQDILREEWGFEGYVVSDSGAVEFLYEKHRVAPTPKEAIRMSVEAGLNIRTHFTQPEDYANPLLELVESGRISMDTIDSRVADILRVKFRLGLFDDPYRTEDIDTDAVVRSEENMKVAHQASRESIILLKNEGDLLPLEGDYDKVLVTGPMADDQRAWWSRYGSQRIDYVTPLEGLRNYLDGKSEVIHVKGVEAADENWPLSDVYKEPASEEVLAGIEEAVAAARDVDLIIACVGETDAQCRESQSRISLDLPGYQNELLQALKETGKPVVLVFSNGRPLSAQYAVRNFPAIVEMWFPGEDGGDALADVLFGEYNPAGRLPVTVAQSVGQLPYNFPTKPGAQDVDYGQISGSLFPFGHGLSYTDFEYRDLSLSNVEAAVGDDIEVELTIRNTGDRDGDEVAQLYLRDDYSSATTYERRLVGFKRVHIKKGQSVRVSFTLSREHLEFYITGKGWVVEPGGFTLYAGASSGDLRLRERFSIVDEEGTVPEEGEIKENWVDPI